MSQPNRRPDFTPPRGLKPLKPIRPMSPWAMLFLLVVVVLAIWFLLKNLG